MPELVLTYSANGNAHSWTDVQTPFDQVKTLINTTGLDFQNAQTNGFKATNFRAHAGIDSGRFKIRNATGENLSANDLVYITGTYSDGTDNYPTVAKADSHATAASNFHAVAIVDATFVSGQDGTALLAKEVTGLNTSGSTVGNPVYLSSTAGGWTLTRPTGGEFIQVVGHVSVVHSGSGRIAFDLSQCTEEYLTGQAGGLGYMLDTDHDSYLYASADDTVKLRVGGTDVITSTASNVTVTGGLTVTGVTTLSGVAVAMGDNDELRFGDAPDYWFVYDATNTAFELNSTNISGGTDGVVFDVQDGTNDVRFVGGISTDNTAAPTGGIITSTITATGEIDGATLDISGNADIDGTLEADAYTVDGTALNEYIADTVGAMVTSNDETNIAVTYQDGDNTLDFAISSIDGTAIGASTPSTGAFTSLSATTDVTVGDDLLLNSDSAVLSLGAGADATLTHDGTEGVTIAANPITLDSGGSLRLDSNTGVWIFKDAGTEVLRFTESSSGDVTIKLVTDLKNLVFSDNGNNINMTILDAAAGINVPGEVQTTGIGYTDGDNAIVIADGGGVTFAAAVDINSGAIDGTTVGASSASTGAFTTLSATGNVNIGGEDAADLNTGYANLQLGGNGAIQQNKAIGAGKDLHISQNAALAADGSWEYISTDEAANYYQLNGEHVFRRAASGTAGNDITWSTAMVIDGTGVGIGTASPGHALEVKGDSKDIRLASADYDIAILSYDGVDTGLMALKDDGNNKVLFTADGDSYITGGDLIIGNDTNLSTPADGAFQVLGTGTADSTVIFGHNSTTDTSKSRLAFVKGAHATIGTHTTCVADGEHLGAISAYGSDTNDFSSMAAEILFEVDGSPGSDDMPGRMSFWTTADSGTAPTRRMTIKADGKVGIGTSAPNRTLEVSDGSGNVPARFSSTDATARIELIDNSSSGGTGIQADGNAISIVEAGTKVLSTDGSGNVGIGETSPGALLHLKKNNGSAAIRMEREDSSVADNDEIGGIIMTGGENNADYPVARIVANADAAWTDTSSPTRLEFEVTPSGSQQDALAMTILSDGKVGIGDASPSMTLHVNSGTINDAALFESTDSQVTVNFKDNSTTADNSCRIYVQGNDMYINTRESGSKLTFETANTGRLTIDGDGKVGIGTSSPDRLLTVKGALGLETTDSTNDWVVYAHTDDTLRFNYNGSGNDEIVVDTSGNVGIGTASPRAKAEVYDSAVSAAYDDGNLATWRVFQVRNNIESATGTGAGIAFGGDGSSDTETAGIVGISTNSTGGVVDLAFLTAEGNDSKERMRIDSGGNVGIGETDPDALLTLNQGAADTAILTFKSSDVGHAITDNAQADTYGAFYKSDAAAGGMLIRGLRDADAGGARALMLDAQLGEAAETSDTTGSEGVMNFLSTVISSNATTAVADDGNAFAFRSTSTRLIIKGDGALHATNITGGQLDGTALDGEDDIGLIRTYERTIHQDAGIAMSKWDAQVESHEEDLRRVGVLVGDFYCQQRMNSLLGGGIWQTHVRVKELEEALNETRTELAEARKQINQLAA